MSAIPLVSIIVPCYNSEKYLLETLHHIYLQTYGNFEVLIIDDGSDDNSGEIAKKFAKDIRVYSQKNAGPSVARNRGMFLARGDYFAFCDADDIWEKDKLALQMEIFLRQPDSGMVSTNGIFIDEQGKFLNRYIVNPISIKLRETCVSTSDLISWAKFYPSATVVSKEAVLSSGLLFDSKTYLFENVFMWLRIAERSRSFFINDLLVKRRYVKSSLSHSSTKKDRYAQIKVFSFCLIDFPAYSIRLKENLIHSLYSAARLELMDNNFSEGKALILKALKIDFSFGRLYWRPSDSLFLKIRKVLAPYFIFIFSKWLLLRRGNNDW